MGPNRAFHLVIGGVLGLLIFSGAFAAEKSTTVTYQSLEFGDIQQLVIVRDGDTGQAAVVLRYNMRRSISGVESGQVQVPLLPDEKQKLRQWIDATVLPRANEALGFGTP